MIRNIRIHQSKSQINITTELQNEIWKPVVGFENVFSVSNLGRLKSIRILRNGKNKETFLKPFISRDGYPAIKLCHNTVRHHRYMHRLVADAFICPRPPGMDINHINGQKLDNRPENLQYVTHAENLAHAAITGLFNTEKRRLACTQTAKKRRKNNMIDDDKLLFWLLIRKCFRENSNLI